MARDPASTDSAGTRTVAGTATTDATGRAAFRGLPSGSYSVVAQPPAGATLGEARYDFGPPRQADVQIGLFLARR